jgi:biotin-(acetyl-CoA carboxylase) ligase
VDFVQRRQSPIQPFDLSRQVPAKEHLLFRKWLSLAIKNTLDQFVDDIRIKWPNDIYWKDKKIAGILIESDIQGDQIEHSIIGAGIKSQSREFPPELPNPVSLRQITGTETIGVCSQHIYARVFSFISRIAARRAADYRR